MKKKNESVPDPVKQVLQFLGDPRRPRAERLGLLQQMLNFEKDETRPLKEGLLSIIEASSEAQVKTGQDFNELLLNLGAGPQRWAVVLDLGTGGDTGRVLVGCDDGSRPYVVVPNLTLKKKLFVGVVVVLDKNAHEILDLAPNQQLDGEVATLEQVLEGGQLSVRLAHDQGMVMNCHHELRKQVSAGTVRPGTTLKVNVRIGLASAVVAKSEGHEQFQFVERTVTSSVRVEDVANAPRVLQEVLDHAKLGINHPNLCRKYNVKSLCRLLAGPSGTGKSWVVEACCRGVADMLSQATGLPLDKLPPFVVRGSPDKYLSRWLGDSDKLVARMVREVKELASTRLRFANGGGEFLAPVIFVLEELDGIGRARGGDSDGLHDRILTGLLRDLNPDSLPPNVILLATTNHAESSVDAALLRRVNGRTERFGRLTKCQAFAAVLTKKVSRLPAASNNGLSQAAIWEDNVRRLADSYYSPNSNDPGFVSLQFAGSSERVTKRAADLMTPALVARAVEEAARESLVTESLGVGSGISLATLARHFEDQLVATAAMLTPQNIHLQTDLPEGQRVMTLNRIPRSRTPPLAMINQTSSAAHPEILQMVPVNRMQPLSAETL